MRLRSAEGKWVIVEARNPVTVFDDQAMLAMALLAVCVDQHPHFPFEILEEEPPAGSDSPPIVRWLWAFAEKSRDGGYITAELIKWWSDPEWLAANPAHEWTTVRTILHCGAAVARAIRESEPREVHRRGDLQCHIPIHATPERRQWLLDQFHGVIPVGTPFPSASTATP